MPLVNLSFTSFPHYQPGLARSPFQAYRHLVGSLGAPFVRVVSVDRLWEQRRTMGSFLICDAALGLSGADHEVCVREVSRREGAMPHSRESPTPVALDAVRLSRLLRHAECVAESGLDLRGNSTAAKVPLMLQAHLLDSQMQSETADITAKLPTTCLGAARNDDSLIEVLSHSFDASFLQQVNAQPPAQLWSKPVCLIDQTALNHEHLKKLRSLSPPCLVHS